VPYFGQFWLKLLKNLHTASWLALVSVFDIEIEVS
jgi:hypothetical protein